MGVAGAQVVAAARAEAARTTTATPEQPREVEQRKQAERASWYSDRDSNAPVYW